MDAVKFLEERNRMCGIPIKHSQAIDAVKAIEQWSAEHPIKTRADVFIELFPKAKEKVYDICPMEIEGMDCMIIMNHIGVCDGCLEAYWNSTAPEGFGNIYENPEQTKGTNERW